MVDLRRNIVPLFLKSLLCIFTVSLLSGCLFSRRPFSSSFQTYVVKGKILNELGKGVANPVQFFAHWAYDSEHPISLENDSNPWAYTVSDNDGDFRVRYSVLYNTFSSNPPKPDDYILVVRRKGYKTYEKRMSSFEEEVVVQLEKEEVPVSLELTKASVIFYEDKKATITFKLRVKNGTKIPIAFKEACLIAYSKPTDERNGKQFARSRISLKPITKNEKFRYPVEVISGSLDCYDRTLYEEKVTLQIVGDFKNSRYSGHLVSNIMTVDVQD